MNIRPLSTTESSNLRQLNAAGIESVLLFLTPTGFKKSICDATTEMRTLFIRHGFHDYDKQQQGQDHKIVKEVRMLLDDKAVSFQMSLYRPITKQGDPRFWVQGWKSVVSADNVLAVFFNKNTPVFINLSFADLSTPFFATYLSTQHAKAHRIANELLDKLRIIAQTPIIASGHGDTFIGRDIETALGISINSSRAPDYKGIELKSKRVKSNTRSGLFCAVPDWDLSAIKSSEELLDCFGYHTDRGFRLYCTVSSKAPNSQGLFLSLADAERLLWEKHKGKLREANVVGWRLSNLEKRLSEKHNETFWIKADTKRINGKECFLLKSVTHTASPNLPQFSRLLATGDITVDHLIKRSETGRVCEKGPQFKIQPSKLDELFLGAPKQYVLA